MAIIASASASVKFVGKSGTYFASIMSPQGDIWQEWSGDIADNPPLLPDFSVTKPIMYFVCTSSRVLEGIVAPASINFEFNGILLTFDPVTFESTNTGLEGVFKRVFPSTGQPYYGLQILKNIAPISGYASATVRMEAAVSYGTQSDLIQASFPISIQQSSGSAYSVHIQAGDSYNFVITKNNTSVIIKAVTYLGGSEVSPSSLSFAWQKMDKNGWVAITNTSQSIVVNADDIQTYGEYRVTVSKGDSILGSDIQSVMDASDPYDIAMCPSPADQTITEDESGNDKVVYTPKVIKRGSNVQVMQGTLFSFVVRSAAGNELAKSSAPCASFTVTRDMCVQAGGPVDIIASAED